MRTFLLLLLLLVGLSSCNQTKKDRYDPTKPYQAPYSGPDLAPGQVVAQGMIGATTFEDVERSGGTNPPVEGQSGDLKNLPMIGGAFQWPLWGERVDAGLEAGGTLGFETGGGYVYAGGGGLVVAVDIDLFIFDLFGGPFVSMALGEKVRIWGGAGPLLQFANYDQSGVDVSGSSSGFGTGLYARAGVDLVVSRSLMVGLGGRWLDSRVSLGNGLGNLDMEGFQWAVTFTSGF